MGFITGAIIYKLGKRRGKKSRQGLMTLGYVHSGTRPRGSSECENYDFFCKNYGSCLDQICTKKAP